MGVRPAAGIQRALYDRLNGTISCPVYDYVDEAAAHPYVTIGEISTESADNTHDGLGRETTIYVHVWSKERGWTQANDIADEVTTLVDHQPLDIDGHHTVSVRFEFGQNITDQNPQIRHVVLRFRITTEQEQ